MIIPKGGEKPLYPPLGALYIASAARKIAKVKVADVASEDIPSEALDDLIEDFAPDIIGITMNTRQVLSAYSIVKRVKRLSPEVRIIVGGPHPSAMAEQTLKECEEIDVAVVSEGEQTVVEILEAYENQRSLDDVKGIVFKRHDGSFVRQSAREPIEDLDTIAFPAYDLISLDSYFKRQSTRMKYHPSLAVMGSRGCPFRCLFCSNPVWRRKVRFRSPQNVANEIEWIHEKFHVREVYFHDDTFDLSPSWVLNLCSELERKNLHQKIVWKAECRVNRQLVSETILRRMRSAGCWLVTFGVESGNQKVLNYMNKEITLDEIYRAFRLAKEAGLKRGCFLTLGHVGETSETIADTIKLAKKLGPDYYGGIQLLVPYPGSGLYDIWVKQVPPDKVRWWVRGETPFFIPKTMSKEDLTRWHRRANLQLRLRPSFIVHGLGEIRSLRMLAEFTKMLLGLAQIPFSRGINMKEHSEESGVSKDLNCDT